MKNPKDFKSAEDLPEVFREAIENRILALEVLKGMSREEIVEQQAAWKLGSKDWYWTFKSWLRAAGLEIVEVIEPKK